MRSTHMMVLGFLAILCTAPQGFAGPTGGELVKFRDLFDVNGKPAIGAFMRNRKQVTLVGFVAPPPDADSKFMVLVAEPTATCPYCTTVDEGKHAAFILVYPDEKIDQSGFGLRTRLRVTGTLTAAHGDEPDYGFHRDVVLENASVVVDERNRRITPAQRRAAERQAAERGATKSTIQPGG